MKEQSSTLFNDDYLNSDQNNSDRKKKSFKLGGSWLKGFANSPIVSKFIGTPVNGYFFF